MATVANVLSSIFSTIPELHSGQLGLLSGVLVGILYWHGHHRSSLAALSGFYLLAIGVVPASTRGLAVVQSKPWYFCSLLLATALCAIIGRVLWMRLPLRHGVSRSSSVESRSEVAPSGRADGDGRR
ncbi:hypothetical protein C488_13188 [Natrinema pellirubrum DSM 15624]|uniref:Uncharacterized protein n=1 Tax=Natrinema pellirubrum (strain DSM 15624 / CIP 106293 / JCM 10476 / NCIMB 786 / 157) TaxID=797303 RepID=L0JM59_NATP1|nr:hypothetical protein [Natrinema pellirubrum]AGB32625.1 hypothetical protein Natpe_2826 [Natrinema pellirubrum DSM 15624]ELY73758.1 hypothetical protein C488_13188 [Natrinema pellirubrum DSM 15624]